MSKKQLGTYYISIIIALIFIGIVTVASLSYPRSHKMINGGYYFLIRHIFWILIGIVLASGQMLLQKKHYQRYAMLYYIIGFFLLLLVLVIGKEVNGAKRWVSIGSITLQPSEFTKVMLIIALAMLLNKGERLKKSKYKLIGIIFICLYALLIVLERSFSSMMQILLIGFSMYYTSETKFRYILLSLICTVPFGVFLVLSTPYRMKRFLEYFHSEGSEQAINSLMAIGNGGIIGRGYMEGIQKNFYLAEIHTDYAFSGFAEEMGFLMSMLLIFLYLLLISIIMYISIKIEDRFSKYVLSGIASMIAVQVIGNLMVVLNILPSTGIPLPIISYGGSNVIVIMWSLGIVYKIFKDNYVNKKVKSKRIINNNKG